MNSHEATWLDLVKEHKWKIIVIAICLFAVISYFSMGSKPVDNFDSAATDLSSQQASATPTSEAVATGTAMAVAPPSASAKPTPPPIKVGVTQQAPVMKSWTPVANAFAKAWSNPKVGKEAWLKAIKPTVTSDLYDQLASTDISRVGQLEVLTLNTEKEDYKGVNARVLFKDTDFTIVIHLMPQLDMTWLVSIVTSS